MSTNRCNDAVWSIRLFALAGAAGVLLGGSAAAQSLGTGVPRLPVVPAGPITITVKAGEGGKISPAGTITVRPGTTQQFELVPNTGWAARSATGCGGTGIQTAGGHATYTTARLSGNCNVVASFIRLQPRLTSFKINNDAAQTLTQSVSLAFTAASGPTYPAASHYRVSMRSDFLGVDWKPMSAGAAIPHQLEPGAGTKTLYFQLRNANLGVSEVLSDSIELAQRQLYTIAAREFYDAAGQAGFWSGRISACGQCMLIPGPAEGIAADKVVVRADASQGCNEVVPRCVYGFFKGKSLAKDFVFKGIVDNASVTCLIFRLVEPVAGGSSVNFEVQLSSRNVVQCQYLLSAMLVEGPPNRNWREALGLRP